jgi:hypothetical protein
MAPGAVGAHVEDMRLLYSPPLALRALGVDSVRIAYAVNDSMVLSRDDSSVTVHINWEPEGANSSYVTIDTTALIVPLAGTDPNGDRVDAAIVDSPDRGSLYISYGEDRVGDDVASYMASGGVHIPVPPGADVAAVRYVPPQLGADDPDEITTSFAYAVYDGQLTGSKLGHVTVRVKRRNRPPYIPLDARDVSVHTLEDRSFIFELSGIDPDDGDVVAARIASLPELGARGATWGCRQARTRPAGEQRDRPRVALRRPAHRFDRRPRLPWPRPQRRHRCRARCARRSYRVDRLARACRLRAEACHALGVQ